MRSRTLSLLAALATTAGSAVAVAVAPAASADGYATPAFAFTSDRDGDGEVFVRYTDGSVRQLTRNAVSDFGAVWSPDGRTLAFSRQVGAGTALFVMRADGSGVRRLTSPVTTPEGQPSYDVSPAWSPDGRQLAFSSNRRGGGPDIWRIRLDGSGPVRVTGGEVLIGDTNPAWSPDGRWLWFDTDRNGDFNRELYRVRPDGTGLQRMTRTPDNVDDAAPDFSPDGSRIVFSSTRANGSQDLYSMRPDGTGVRPLGTPTAGQDEVFPRWTANGSAVLHWRFGTADDPRERIWLIDADGTDRRVVAVGSGDNFGPDPYPVARR